MGVPRCARCWTEIEWGDITCAACPPVPDINPAEHEGLVCRALKHIVAIQAAINDEEPGPA